MIDPEFLALLRCPVTGQSLSAAPSEILDRINRDASEKVAEGLLRADGTAVYPVREGIPILLVDAAIPV